MSVRALRAWMVVAWAAATACGGGVATPAELEAYRRARGELVVVETTDAGRQGRYLVAGVRLRSSSGLVATGRLLRPATGTCLPAALLQDGREENSGVVGRLTSDFGDVVVLALDYPEDFPYRLRWRELLEGRRLERPARRVPALFLLGARYLASRGDVDSTRIVLAATSFAVPFATIAAAAEPRFTNVALIYGAGDLPGVVAANLPDVPRPLRRLAASAALQPFAAFAPERFVGLIAPRPLLMVNGEDDPQMPTEAVRRLFARAGEPKRLIWMRTGHLMPTDSGLIRQLLDTSLALLPALRGASPGSACGRERVP